MIQEWFCAENRTILLTTHDHKPNLKLEKLRIEENGGTVSNGRVNGILAVSRSLGDFNFKDRVEVLEKLSCFSDT